MANWDAIKQEWETTKITLAALAEKYSMPLGTIKSRKSRDAKDGNPWSRDGTKKDATKPQKVATKKKVVAQDEIITSMRVEMMDLLISNGFLLCITLSIGMQSKRIKRHMIAIIQRQELTVLGCLQRLTSVMKS